MRLVFRFLKLCFLAAVISAQPALGSELQTTAIVLSLSKETANAGVVEFYRAVAGTVANRSDVRVARSQEVAQIMARHKSAWSLGALPVFERSLLVKVHPEASGKSKTKMPPKSKRLITPVQVMLDTLALPGSIIVDCATAIDGSLKACGLYYYDRAKGRITVSSVKTFRAGVLDATRWSSLMVDELHGALTQAKAFREKEKVLKALDAMGTAKETGRLSFGLGVGGVETRAEGRDAYVPRLAIAFGREWNGFGLNLVYQMAKAEKSRHETFEVFSERALLFEFKAGAKALQDLTWNLHLDLGIAERSYASTFSSNALAVASPLSGGSISSRSLKSAIGPGMSWSLSETYSLGASVRFNKYFEMKTGGEGSISGDRFNSGGLDLGMHFTTFF